MSDVVQFDPEWCCWAASGWEDALEGSVRDARRVTRIKAHADFAREAGEPFPEVRVWKRYIRPWTRDDRYVWWVENRTENGWDDIESTDTPDGWDATVVEYDESCPSWEFVHKAHPAAIPAWICGFKGDDAPLDLDRGQGES